MFYSTIEPIKIAVISHYLNGGKTSSVSNTIEAYLIGVKAVTNRALQFTVYTENGAVWSGLPIEALVCNKFNTFKQGGWRNEALQPFSCLEGPIQVYVHPLVENQNLKIKILGKANYLFTIDYAGRGLSEDPEQFKTHNICVLENGQLCAVPNNYCEFEDNWFKSSPPKNYKRNSKTYFAGG